MKKTLLFTLLCVSTIAYAQRGHDHDEDYAYKNHSHWQFTVAPCVKGIYYNFSSKGAEVTYGYSGFRYIGNIVIPSTVQYGGQTYTVTSIGEDAFKLCNELTAVTIPQTVKTIGKNAFYKCYDLAAITIPANVTQIASSAFSECLSLAAITVESGNEHYSSENGVLFNKNKTSLIHFPRTKTGAYVIPEGVTSIVDYAFHNCSGLSSISIPQGVTNIGAFAFSGCNNLTSIIIPEGVTIIWNDVFSGCTSLDSIALPRSVTRIGNNAFGDSGLTSITIPEGVTDIDGYAFWGCSKLSLVSIPASVKKIGYNAFGACKAIITVDSRNAIYFSVDGELIKR
ncbi:MAG: leucine-rich repeat domain-containing protein [Bacteroidetes bacterium]|nr:leucine-rich repeat domain-containing protein [Bacteroidota bacterium]